MCKNGYESDDCSVEVLVKEPQQASPVVSIVIGLVVGVVVIASAVGVVLFLITSKRKRLVKNIQKEANGFSTTNQTYTPSITEDPLYENAIGNNEKQSNVNIYDNNIRKDSGAALYGNVDVINGGAESPIIGDEYESLALQPSSRNDDKDTNMYECLRKTSEPETSLYTGLKYGEEKDKVTKKRKVSKGVPKKGQPPE